MSSAFGSASNPPTGGASGCNPNGPCNPTGPDVRGKQLLGDSGPCVPSGPDPEFGVVEGWTLVSGRRRLKRGLAIGAPLVHACKPRHGDRGPRSGVSFGGKAGDCLPLPKERQSRFSSLEAICGKTWTPSIAPGFIPLSWRDVC